MRVRLLLVAMLLSSGCLSEPAPAPGSSSGGDDPAPRNATAPAWGALESATIRPGASLGGYCTFNFLFHDGNGTAYIGTAAHCVEEVGERVSLGDGTEVGEVVMDDDLEDSGVDFALIRIDEDKVALAHPQMLGFAGPTGSVTTDDLAVGDIIQVYGYGIVVGQNEATRARQGALVDWNEREYNVDMPAVNGDSGAALLHESGKAFGIISRYGFANTPPSTDQGPMMPWIFEQLEAAGFADVRLATV